MNNHDKEIIASMEYNMEEKQRIIDKMIQTDAEGELYQANLAIMESLLKILEILTNKTK